MGPAGSGAAGAFLRRGDAALRGDGGLLEVVGNFEGDRLVPGAWGPRLRGGAPCHWDWTSASGHPRPGRLRGGMRGTGAGSHPRPGAPPRGARCWVLGRRGR